MNLIGIELTTYSRLNSLPSNRNMLFCMLKMLLFLNAKQEIRLGSLHQRVFERFWIWRPLCLAAASATDWPQTDVKCSCPRAASSPRVPAQGCLRKPSKAISLPAGSAHKWTCLNKIRVPLSLPDPRRHLGRNHCRLSCIPALIYD